ncbi:hypothetical protein [Rhizobium laguerreae]|uniref:hypothetical protein n=1 Tax=Rhizobium laguerreae TaxID=1076926 RepID=UPI001C923D0D|nr:hypothetical protein [Rhizobium laguerreae]MBY3220951.1 hypothetical protein [Rhizobium laguerreae]
MAQAKRVLISLRVQATRGISLKPDSLCAAGRTFRMLIYWMFLSGYSNLSDLTDENAMDYVDFVVAQFVEDDLASRTADTLALYIDALARVYEQSSLFEQWPDVCIARHPLYGKKALAVARQNIKSITKHISPVPDQVHLPSIREALNWVRVKAPDIFRLATIEQTAREACRRWKSNNYNYYINDKVVGFNFNLDGTVRKAWRAPIKAEVYVTVEDENGEKSSRWSPSRQIRDLYECLRDASCLTLEALVGFRISEIAGLQAHPRQANGWPHCLTLRPSMDGLREVFFVRGKVFKGTDEFEEVEWVAGIRPVGSDQYPDAVEAIFVLDKLYDYWRTLAGRNDLILSFGAVPGLPREPETLSPILSDVLCRSQKSFIRRFVEVEERFRFWNVTTHQWRKKFAQDIIRIDRTALPSVREHFKHLSDFVTDTAYLGSNPSLLKLVDNERLRAAARDFLDIIVGERKFIGKMATIVQRELTELRAACELLPSKEEKLEAVERALKTHDVKAWRCEYGTCLFRNDTSLCHFIVKGLYNRTARRPLAQERCADVCCGCSNLVISESHIPFWLDRYWEHKQVCEASIEAGETAIAGLANQRMHRAKAILLKFGFSAEELA